MRDEDDKFKLDDDDPLRLDDGDLFKEEFRFNEKLRLDDDEDRFKDGDRWREADRLREGILMIPGIGDLGDLGCCLLVLAAIVVSLISNRLSIWPASAEEDGNDLATWYLAEVDACRGDKGCLQGRFALTINRWAVVGVFCSSSSLA